MNILIRQIVLDENDREATYDRDIQTDVLSIGSATDCDVQVLGEGLAAVSAQVRLRGARLQIARVASAPLHVNEKAVSKSDLSVGDTVSLAGNELHVIAPPTGFDSAFELRLPRVQDASAYENAFVTSLSQTRWSIRRFSWMFALAVLFIAAVIPSVSLMLERQGTDIPDGVPSDVLWSSGPLHSAHVQAVGDNCSACHQEPFVQVRDQACVDCHTSIESHEALAVLDKHPADTFRCASCHREHNEPASSLVITADNLCTDCHTREQINTDAEPPLSLVSSFSTDAHPTFAPTVLRFADSDMDFKAWKVTPAKSDVLKEGSNLLFPHQVHLDAEQVQMPDSGDGLLCADCHTASSDGEHFEPVTMENSCVSCHELAFDLQNSERQLPHGKPEEVIFALEGYYLKTLASPNAQLGPSKKRRRPDKNRAEKACVGYECALEQAAAEAESQFTVKGCVSCHEVSTLEDAPLNTRYQVKPVSLNADYFPAARFDHTSHLVLNRPGDDERLEGAQACESCHAAGQSTQSSDVLMPAIDNCTQCHSSSFDHSSNVVTAPLACTDCHSYHPAEPVNRAQWRSEP